MNDQNKFETMMEKLEAERDELRVKLNLAKMEATVPGDVVWLGEREPAPAEGHGHNIGKHVREIPAPMDPRVPYPDFHQGASYMEHVALADAIRNGKPAARLVPIHASPVGVRIGVARGKFTTPEPDPELEAEAAALFGGPGS